MQTRSSGQKERPSREEMIASIEKQSPGQAEKLRLLAAKESFLKEKNVYGEIYSERQIGICYDAIFSSEHLRSRILEATRAEALSVKQIAERLGAAPREILWEVVELRRKNLLAIEIIRERTPLYRAVG
ncbi:MAG: hypothetical protein AB1640_22640 [bacterium]